MGSNVHSKSKLLPPLNESPQHAMEEKYPEELLQHNVEELFTERRRKWDWSDLQTPKQLASGKAN
jgi:hypothetical protein